MIHQLHERTVRAQSALNLQRQLVQAYLARTGLSKQQEFIFLEFLLYT